MAWSKARINKMLATRKANAEKRANASLRSAAHDPIRMARIKNAAIPPTPNVIEAHYAGEQSGASLDVNRIEDRAFRRGLFTGLQMVVDLLIRELR
jgi:hypothetical protein